MRRRLSALLPVSGLLVAVFVGLPASAGCGLGSLRNDVTAYRSASLGSAPVVVYGDSITFQVAERLSSLDPRAVAVDAWPGRRTLDAVESLTRDLPGRSAPAAVVMALGTNDTDAPWAVGALVRQARAVVPTGTRLLWLTTYAEPWPGWEDVNREIAAIPGVEVLDWAALNAQARAASANSPLLSDGVHLACDGADAWLELVRGALRGRG